MLLCLLPDRIHVDVPDVLIDFSDVLIGTCEQDHCRCMAKRNVQQASAVKHLF